MFEMHIMVFVLSQMGQLGAFPLIDKWGPYEDLKSCEEREAGFHEKVNLALIEIRDTDTIQFIWTDCQPVIDDEKPEAFAGDAVG